ncbi:unnamed protein product [Porites lobata]|uniref:Tick transposon n=1 Tax=Porites lobata TaxID=104759 RepID=A0ABN8MQM7_9CNID|nr:unnamed protein product [Porites lobata]
MSVNMAAIIGNLGPFDEKSEKFSDYADRFEAYFWTASQGESESVSEFVVRLKKLASTCSFAEFLSKALRDRLVSELHSKMSKTQCHFLSIRDLTFAVAHDKCVADEMV